MAAATENPSESEKDAGTNASNGVGKPSQEVPHQKDAETNKSQKTGGHEKEADVVKKVGESKPVESDVKDAEMDERVAADTEDEGGEGEQGEGGKKENDADDKTQQEGTKEVTSGNEGRKGIEQDLKKTAEEGKNEKTAEDTPVEAQEGSKEEVEGQAAEKGDKMETEETDLEEKKEEKTQKEGKEQSRESNAGASLVQQVIKKMGGRHSSVMGIDVDKGQEEEIDKWFLVSLLFSRGVNTEQTLRTYKILSESGGIRTVKDAGHLEYQQLWDKMVEAKAQRTDQMCHRLQNIAGQIESELGGTVASLRGVKQSKDLVNALKRFNGVGPTTAELFLRELRGVWEAADDVAISDRAIAAARHLGLIDAPKRGLKRSRGGAGGRTGGRGGKKGQGEGEEREGEGEGEGEGEEEKENVPASNEQAFERIAREVGADLRDVETALINMHNVHNKAYAKCPGGSQCLALQVSSAA